MARRTHLVRSAPRTSIWIGAGISAVTTTAMATLIASLNAAALALRPFTIVRTRMKIHYVSDQNAASEATQAAFGIQVVTEVAATAGAGSVPTPITEPDADYFVYEPLFSDFDFIDATGFQQNANTNTTTVDSKAMRKVDVDDDVVFTLEQRNVLGTIISLEGRMLIKLH